MEGGHLLQLSPIDMRMFGIRYPVLFVFPTPETQPAAKSFDLQRLEQSFRALLEDEYRVFLGTELRQDPVTGIVTVHAKPDATRDESLIEVCKDAGHCTTDVTDSPSAAFLPMKLMTEPIKVKCTLLNDGGLVIGLSMNHSMMDAHSTFTMLKVWGQHYRSVAKTDRLSINHDRHLLHGTGVGPVLDHPEYEVRPPTPPPSSETMAALPKTSHVKLHLSPSLLNTLKSWAQQPQDEGNIAAKPTASTLDVVTAVLTMLISQARGHAQYVRTSTVVNGRRRIEPPLPDNYTGNCIFTAQSIHAASLLEITQTDPAFPLAVAMVAQRIRQSIQLMDNTYVRDTIELVQAATPSHIQNSTRAFFGKDILFSSWAGMGMFDADFGGITPFFAAPPDVPLCDGMVVFLDTMAGRETAGLEMIVYLESQAMTRFMKSWSQLTPLNAAFA